MLAAVFLVPKELYLSDALPAMQLWHILVPNVTILHRCNTLSVPNVTILHRCNTLSVESQLQGKRPSGWVMFSGRPAIDCLRNFCLKKLRGFACLATLGLASMILHYKIVITVV